MKKHRLITIFVVVIWLSAVSLGWSYLNHYMSRPGEVGVVPDHWPEQVLTVAEAGDWRTLVFLHPKCPCSRATIDTIREVWQTHQRGQLLLITVLPEGVPQDWHQTDIYQKAQKIPNATLVMDRDGHISERFGARTSGHVLVYDPSGDLSFSGGVTPWRGHAGPSGGKRALEVLLADRDDTQPASADVYGCPLCPAQTNTSDALSEACEGQDQPL